MLFPHYDSGSTSTHSASPPFIISAQIYCSELRKLVSKNQEKLVLSFVSKLQSFLNLMDVCSRARYVHDGLAEETRNCLLIMSIHPPVYVSRHCSFFFTIHGFSPTYSVALFKL